MDKSGITLTTGKTALGGKSAIPGGLGNISVGVLSATQDLAQVKTLLTLKGEIIEIINDDTVRVRTDRGDVDVQIKDTTQRERPRQGQSVEIEIKPGTPPKEARLNPIQKSETHQPRHIATPIDINVTNQTQTAYEASVVHANTKSSPYAAPQNLNKAEPILLNQIEPGTTVRLEPLSSKQANSFIASSAPLSIDVVLKIPNGLEVLPASSYIPLNAEKIEIQTSQTTTASSYSSSSETVSETALIQNIRNNQIISPEVRVVTQAVTEPQGQPQTFIQTTTTVLPTVIAGSAITSHLGARIEAQLAQNTETIPPQNQTRATTSTIDQNTNFFSDAARQAINVTIQSIQAPAVQIVEPQQTLQTRNTAPQNQSPVISSNISAATLTATVSGKTANNLPIISISVDTPETTTTRNYALHIPVSDAVIGTQIELSAQTTLSTPTPIGVATPTLPVYLTAGSWPVMQELYQTLSQIAPASAQTISNITASPATPVQITPAALFFVAALRAGDIGSWIGDKTLDILRSEGKTDLLSKLSREGGILSRLSSEAVSQDWRALTLPMIWDNEMQKVNLFYRHEQDESGENQNGKQTRFVMDLKFSNIGPVQVDGLFREKRLDLILRTEDTFSQNMQMQMRRAFTNALKETQISGDLNFQNQPEQWVKVNIEDKKNQDFIA